MEPYPVSAQPLSAEEPDAVCDHPLESESFRSGPQQVVAPCTPVDPTLEWQMNIVQSKLVTHQMAWVAQQYRAMCSELFAQYHQDCAAFRKHITVLEAKLTELERWRTSTIQLMKGLRAEHKVLKSKLLPEKATATDAESATTGTGDTSVEATCSAVAAVHEPGLDRQNSQSAVHVPDASLASPGVASETLSTGLALPEALSPPPGLPSPAELTPLPQLSGADLLLSDVKGTHTSAGNDVDQPVVIKYAQRDGHSCVTIVWRIARFSHQMGSAMGRALVSPAVTLNSHSVLDDVRIMVKPDDADRGPRSRREKELYQKKVRDGPLSSFLKIKIPAAPQGTLKYRVFVGNYTDVARVHSFYSTPIATWHDSSLDWIREIQSDGSLHLGIELEMPKA